MLKKERQTFISHQVNQHNKVLSSTLSAEINVSIDDKPYEWGCRGLLCHRIEGF
jgi:hypothetical protein